MRGRSHRPTRARPPRLARAGRPHRRRARTTRRRCSGAGLPVEAGFASPLLSDAPGCPALPDGPSSMPAQPSRDARACRSPFRPQRAGRVDGRALCEMPEPERAAAPLAPGPVRSAPCSPTLASTDPAAGGFRSRCLPLPGRVTADKVVYAPTKHRGLAGSRGGFFLLNTTWLRSRLHLLPVKQQRPPSPLAQPCRPPRRRSSLQ